MGYYDTKKYDEFFNNNDEFIYNPRRSFMLLAKIKEKHSTFNKMRASRIDFSKLFSYGDGYFAKNQEDIQHIYKVISWFREVI